MLASCSPTERLHQEATKNEDSLQSNKKRRYMRRGSKSPSMLMLSSMPSLEGDEDSTGVKEKQYTLLSDLTEAILHDLSLLSLQGEE
jgi:hypothetical protein